MDDGRWTIKARLSSVAYRLKLSPSSMVYRPSSLITKSDHRVYLRRAARGDEAGEERRRREQRRDEHEGQRVGRRDAVEQARHQTRRGEGPDEPQTDAREREPHP